MYSLSFVEVLNALPLDTIPIDNLDCERHLGTILFLGAGGGVALIGLNEFIFIVCHQSLGHTCTVNVTFMYQGCKFSDFSQSLFIGPNLHP